VSTGLGECQATYFDGYVNWLEKQEGYSAIAGLLATRKVTRNMYAPVPMTHEKLSAMAVAQDDCVRDIRDFMNDNPTALAFQVSDFEKIFEKHNVDKASKYKLQDAGLIPPTKRRYIGKEHLYIWLRQGHSIKAIAGQGTSVVTPDGREIGIKMALFSR
jgi:hypothetical protein